MSPHDVSSVARYTFVTSMVWGGGAGRTSAGRPAGPAPGSVHGAPSKLVTVGASAPARVRGGRAGGRVVVAPPQAASAAATSRDGRHGDRAAS